MDYLDGFSGYGGFHLALENSGFKFDNCYFSEIDKHAIANYSHNFPKSKYAGSITTISRNTIPNIDIFTFGWPCQDNSIAGKRKGQSGGTRSGLLYEAVRIIDEFRPRHFIAENVLGLLSVNEGQDFVKSLEILSYLNQSCPQYDIEMQLLNTRWVLPQNRERLFFIGHLRGTGSRQVFPIGEHDKIFNNNSKDNKEVDWKVANCLMRTANFNGDMNLVAVSKRNGIVEKDPIADTLLGRYYKGYGGRDSVDYVSVNSNTKNGYETASEGDSINFSFPNSKTRRGRVGKGVSQTLDKSCNQGVIQINPSTESGGKQPYQQNRVYDIDGISPALNSQISDQYKITSGTKIRRYTPIECERLQGLPDNWTKYGNCDGKIKELSDTQRYRLCGNGVSVPIVELITKKLYDLNYKK